MLDDTELGQVIFIYFLSAVSWMNRECSGYSRWTRSINTESGHQQLILD